MKQMLQFFYFSAIFEVIKKCGILLNVGIEKRFAMVYNDFAGQCGFVLRIASA